ncbi:calmodulin-binding transcription activator [Striga asiatica]|uniref:Calmodulin-binding transcription activator n=1 Tax=Striga asiatica TaxID=4170 RepID=A0A5A7PBF3_STRAF|nr:calmodulin-binding transcription activator [Striga asiatica]
MKADHKLLTSSIQSSSMAESGSSGNLGFRLDIKQILSEAQHRWLRPAEIAEILRNYQKFHISPEAPNKPVSGSVFLFDRKVLRYFRKDGHNWRKKKDGKTVKEAHEKLKVGSVDMLHCYYAHGEDNEYFQRRSYWLLEEDRMHIVFVHYLEVKGNKMNISSLRSSDTVASNSENNSLLSSSFRGASPSSTMSSAYEDAESEFPVEDNHQASSRFHSYVESPFTVRSDYVQSSSCNQLSLPGDQSALSLNYASLSQSHTDPDLSGISFAYGGKPAVDLASWQEVLGNSTSGDIAYQQESGSSLPVHHSFGDGSLHNPSTNQNSMPSLPRDHGRNFEEISLPLNQQNFVEPFCILPHEQSVQKNLQLPLLDAETGNNINPNVENVLSMIGNENYSILMKKPLISGLQKDESLKKVDSFSRWMANELGGSGELNLHSDNGISWSIMGNEYDSNMPGTLQADTDTLNPSISQDQLFSITECLPNYAYADLETKVLITGIFLKSKQELSKCRWSIMFGQEEVAAEVFADGVLCCLAPPHEPGLVPFYVTCSNRLACSEVREFEYRPATHPMGSVYGHADTAIVMHLYQRFEMILSRGPAASSVNFVGNDSERQNIVNKIVSMMEEENNQEIKMITDDTSVRKGSAQVLLEKQLKEKFYSWLVHRVTEDGKGLTVLDEWGQGVLHLSAALGFNWALQPIIVSGISIDFRDVNGWTALHWAAFYGREETVAALVSLGATPGALTDPSAECPLARTPADLASLSGHKGISGFLAESSLTTQLSNLGVDDQSTSEVSCAKAVQTVSERSALSTGEGDVPDALSLKDSLAAVCNATQAAARIHQIFRIQSFQRKQFVEKGVDELLGSDERAISLTASRASGLGQSGRTENAAAVRIQKKFRGWKKRKEFLLIRQKVVKIQAHFRGHQVRKKYKPIIWSVGIMEKVILRWRRKGSGLRGFRSDAVPKVPNAQDTFSQEDDYDFLKEGRKQTEERMQKALSRVKSMTQYPEARAQYRRLLTAAKDFRETKEETSDTIPESIENVNYPEEDLLDIESLLDDDTFMSLAFE